MCPNEVIRQRYDCEHSTSAFAARVDKRRHPSRARLCGSKLPISSPSTSDDRKWMQTRIQHVTEKHSLQLGCCRQRVGVLVGRSENMFVPGK